MCNRKRVFALLLTYLITLLSSQLTLASSCRDALTQRSKSEKVSEARIQNYQDLVINAPVLYGAPLAVAFVRALQSKNQEMTPTRFYQIRKPPFSRTELAKTTWQELVKLLRVAAGEVSRDKKKQYLSLFDLNLSPKELSQSLRVIREVENNPERLEDIYLIIDEFIGRKNMLQRVLSKTRASISNFWGRDYGMLLGLLTFDVGAGALILLGEMVNSKAIYLGGTAVLVASIWGAWNLYIHRLALKKLSFEHREARKLVRRRSFARKRIARIVRRFGLRDVDVHEKVQDELESFDIDASIEEIRSLRHHSLDESGFTHFADDLLIAAALMPSRIQAEFLNEKMLSPHEERVLKIVRENSDQHLDLQEELHEIFEDQQRRIIRLSKYSELISILLAKLQEARGDASDYLSDASSRDHDHLLERRSMLEAAIHNIEMLQDLVKSDIEELEFRSSTILTYQQAHEPSGQDIAQTLEASNDF